MCWVQYIPSLPDQDYVVTVTGTTAIKKEGTYSFCCSSSDGYVLFVCVSSGISVAEFVFHRSAFFVDGTKVSHESIEREWAGGPLTLCV